MDWHELSLLHNFQDPLAPASLILFQFVYNGSSRRGKGSSRRVQYMNTHCFKPPSEAFENASKTHRCFSACFRHVHLPSPGEPPASKNTRSRETSGARLVGSSCSARDMEVCALRNQSCYRKLAQPAAVVSLFYTFLSCLALTSEVKRSVAPPDPLRLLAGSPLNIGCRVEEVRTDMSDSAMPCDAYTPFAAPALRLSQEPLNKAYRPRVLNCRGALQTPRAINTCKYFTQHTSIEYTIHTGILRL